MQIEFKSIYLKCYRNLLTQEFAQKLAEKIGVPVSIGDYCLNVHSEEDDVILYAVSLIGFGNVEFVDIKS